MPQHDWRRRDSETSSFRPPTQIGFGPSPFGPSAQPQILRVGGSKTFRPPRRSNGQRGVGAETRPFCSSWRGTGRSVPYHRNQRPRREERSALVLPDAPPTGFRTGRLSGTTRAAPITRSFEPIAPTAIVRIESGGRLHLVRALIDSCAPNTITDADFARDLQLERSRSGRKKGRSLVLREKYGNTERISTQATIVARHNRLSPPSSIAPTVSAPFQFLRLAGPYFYRASSIRLTLGVDVYAQIKKCLQLCV